MARRCALPMCCATPEIALSSEMIFPELSVCGVPASLPTTAFAKASVLLVTKTIHTGASQPQLEVELGHG